MAKVAGRDVLIDLSDSVNQLKAGQARLEQGFERMAARLDLMSTRMDLMAERAAAMSGRVDQLASDVAALASHVAALGSDVGFLSGACAEISDDQTSLRGDFVRMAETTRQNQAILGRMATLLTGSLESNDERFAKIEARLSRVEKKTG